MQRARLRDRGFGEEQFERLARCGVVPRSEAMRLAVLSCAEYAARVGDRNPMGLFRFLVAGEHWDRPAQQDEDRARRWTNPSREGGMMSVGECIRSSRLLPERE